MNEDEIMKNFAEAFEEKTKEEIIPYKAQSNLNTAIGTPNADIGSPTETNINTNSSVNDTMLANSNTADSSSYLSPPTEASNTNNFTQNNNDNSAMMPQDLVYQSNYQADVTEKYYPNSIQNSDGPDVNYVTDSSYSNPTKKGKTIKFSFNAEIKTVIVIAILLYVIIMFLPQITTFIKNIELNYFR